MAQKGVESNSRAANVAVEKNNQKEENKKKFPWGKFLLGAGIVVAVVETVIRIDTHKPPKTNKLKELFPSLKCDEIKPKRLFPTISEKYEELIIQAATEGNVSKKTIDEIPKEFNAEKLIEYVKATQDLKNAGKKICSDNFVIYEKGFAGKAMEEAVSEADNAHKKIKKLYEQFVRPLQEKHIDNMA